MTAQAGLGTPDAAGWAVTEEQGAAEKRTFEKTGGKSWFKSILCRRGLGTPCGGHGQVSVPGSRGSKGSRAQGRGGTDGWTTEPWHGQPRRLIPLSPCNVLADGCDETFYFSPAKLSISIIIAAPPRGSRSLAPASSCRDPERGRGARQRPTGTGQAVRCHGAAVPSVSVSHCPRHPASQHQSGDKTLMVQTGASLG